MHRIVTYLPTSTRMNLRLTCAKMRNTPGLTDLRKDLLHERGGGVPINMLEECPLLEIPFEHLDATASTVAHHLRAEHQGGTLYGHQHYITNFEVIRTACSLPALNFILIASELKISIYDLNNCGGSLHQTLSIPCVIKFFPNTSNTLVACQVISEDDPQLYSVRLVRIINHLATLIQLDDDDTYFHINTSNIWLNTFSFIVFRNSDIRLILLQERQSTYRSYSCLTGVQHHGTGLKESLMRAVTSDVINWTTICGFSFLLNVRCQNLECGKIHVIERWEIQNTRVEKIGSIHIPCPILGFKILAIKEKYGILCCVDYDADSKQPIYTSCPHLLDYDEYDGTVFMTGYFDEFVTNHLFPFTTEENGWCSTTDAHDMGDMWAIGHGIPLAFDQLWDLGQSQICWIDNQMECYKVAPLISPRTRGSEHALVRHEAHFSNLTPEIKYSGDIWFSSDEKLILLTANDFTSLIVSRLGYKGPASCDMRSMLIVNEFQPERTRSPVIF